MERLRELIVRAMHRPKTRRKTRPIARFQAAAPGYKEAGGGYQGGAARRGD